MIEAGEHVDETVEVLATKKQTLTVKHLSVCLDQVVRTLISDNDELQDF